MIERHLDRLESQLSVLSDGHQLAFSAACCERSFPFYHLFASREKWGTERLFQEALEAIWGSVLDPKTKLQDLERLREQCERGVPDSDDFPSELATAAQEASFAILVALEQALSPNVRGSRRIASFLRDTLDLYVQTLRNMEPDDPQLEERIASDPLMRAELEKQAADVALLSRQPRLTPDFLKQFRKGATDSGGISHEVLLKIDSRQSRGGQAKN